VSAVNRVLDRLRVDRRAGRTAWRAHCPAHRDSVPSLSVRRSNGKILLHCFAGCRTSDVLSRIGLTFADLFERRR
jgi:hypothetical protein